MARRTRLVSLITAALVLLGGLSAASAQELTCTADSPCKMKFATVAPDNTPWAALLKKYKKQIKKASEGRLKIKVYLGGVKGDEQSIVRQIYKGSSLHAGGTSTGAMAVIVPEMDILELPFLFDNFKHADRVLDEVRPLVEEIMESKGFKLLMYSENGYRSIGTKNGFIKSPKDLKAMKVRSQESPVHVETWRAMGASPVTISVGEVLSALQTGVVDGFDNTPLYTQAVSWQQAIKYFSVTEHIYQPAVVFVNKKWFDRLPGDLRQLLLDTGRKLEKKGRKAVRALEPALLDNFRSQGVNVYELTAGEKDAFRKATKGVWPIRRKSASARGKALLDALMKAKAK